MNPTKTGQRRPVVQEISFRTIRPYAMNAMKRPSQHAAHNDGRGLAVLGVRPDEHDALDRQDCGGHHGERRLPVEGGRDDQPDRADEFEDAEDHPGFAMSDQGLRRSDKVSRAL